MKFQHLRCLMCSWKCFFTLCVLCICLNLLLLNVYFSFLYPLVYPKVIDCIKYRKNYKENNHFILNQDFQLNSKLIINNTNKILQNWFAITEHSYVYSVYHSKCPPKFGSSKCIQFIGITLNATLSNFKPNLHESTTFLSSLKCGIRKHSMTFDEGLAFIELMPEGHFLPYTAAFFYCNLNSLSDSDLFPEYVTIYDKKPLKWFRIEKVAFKENFQLPALSLCVRPLYGSFSKLFLLQFLSYYVSEGVDHFFFYHHNVSQSTLEYLSYISQTNLISLTLLPWNIPLSNNEIHEYGQIVFTQDCLSRSRYKYSHTLLVDLDEFIVPKEHRTLIQFVTYLDEYYPYGGSYVIPNVLFCEEFQTVPNFSLPVLHHNQRQKTLWAYGYRSKYIARAHRVRYGGVHQVWGFENGYKEINVPSSVALLHHYKPCCGMQQTWFLHLLSFNVLDDQIITDNSLHQNGFNDTLSQLLLTLNIHKSI